MNYIIIVRCKFGGYGKSREESKVVIQDLNKKLLAKAYFCYYLAFF